MILRILLSYNVWNDNFASDVFQKIRWQQNFLILLKDFLIIGICHIDDKKYCFGKSLVAADF